MNVAFIFLPPWDPQFPSYAMALFKASTKKSGYSFYGLDLSVELYRAVQEEDKKLWDPQIAHLWLTETDNFISKYSGIINDYIDQMIRSKIGLYALSINVYSKNLSLYMAKKIKEKDSNACILFGGPQCFPAYDGLGVLDNEHIDAICTGEGDLVWPRILDHFSKYENLHLDTPGLSYRDSDNVIIDNGVPEIVNDLNSIPFADYSDVDFKKYGNKFQFSIMTSRGCVNSCAFCSEKPNFGRYRFRSAQNIFMEIKNNLDAIQNSSLNKLSSNVIPYISFVDSLINGAPKELEKFCDLVIESGYRFMWGGMALIRKELTYDLLSKMKKAGCYNLAWGMESGCQEVLDLMNKSYFDVSLAKETIKNVKKLGLHQSISLIAGFPGETHEMFLKTARFVDEIKDYVTVSVQPMMISNNSPVHDEIESYGIARGSDWLKWQTIDGTNTYEIRLQRVEILRSILDGKLGYILK